MTEAITLTRKEYEDLRRRYLGLEWPSEDVSVLEAAEASERMGVPLEEFLTDLAQLRQQRANNEESVAFRREHLMPKQVRGKRGIWYFVGLVGLAYVLFMVLMLSINWFVPGDRNLQDRRPVVDSPPNPVNP